MRFDFHLTTEGWRISEVNSDVPGGFTEASHFARLVSGEYGLPPAGDPLAAWANAIAHSAAGKPVALAYTPGFVEDMQIMACMRGELAAWASPLISPNRNNFDSTMTWLI